LYGNMDNAKHPSAFKQNSRMLWRKTPHDCISKGNPFLIPEPAQPPASIAQNVPSESLSASG
jgi:hypothetical protein